MACSVNFLASLDVWTLGTIEDKNRQKGGVHESGTAEEQCSKHWVFSLPAVFRVEEPNAGVNAQTKTAFSIWVCFKTFFNSEIG